MLLWDHFQFQKKPNFVHKALKTFSGFCRNTLKCSFLKHLLSSPHPTEESCPGEPPASWEILCSLLTFVQARRRPAKLSVGTSTGLCVSALRKGDGVGPGQEKGQQLCRARWSPPWAEGQTTSSRNATMLLPRKPRAPESTDALYIKYPVMLFITGVPANSSDRSQPAQNFGNMRSCELFHAARTHGWSPPSYPAAASCSAPCRILLGHVVGFQSHF